MEAELDFKDNRRDRRATRPVRIEDFWLKMQKPVGCWLFEGAKEINGYGYLHNPLPDGPKFITAHRLAWILINGAIPEGMKVLHRCDVRSCCNPEHLFLGTHGDNMADMARKGRNGSSGEKNIHAKLTEAQARYVKANYRKLGPGRGNGSKIARELGVTPGVVHAIGQGRTWKHLK